jgi:hypothetical protein
VGGANGGGAAAPPRSLVRGGDHLRRVRPRGVPRAPRGGAVRVESSCDPQLESAWFQPFELKCDFLVSKVFAFSKFNLYRYTAGPEMDAAVAGLCALPRGAARAAVRAADDACNVQPGTDTPRTNSPSLASSSSSPAAAAEALRARLAAAAALPATDVPPLSAWPPQQQQQHVSASDAATSAASYSSPNGRGGFGGSTNDRAGRIRVLAPYLAAAPAALRVVGAVQVESS